MKSKKEDLIKLYQKTSKHSNYQILPSSIRAIMPNHNLEVNSRFEEERLDFLKDILDFENKKIIDVGGNTGYFSFELIDEGAEKIIFIEGNKPHADFVGTASNYLNKNISVVNSYLDFKTPIADDDIDIVLLFNVLHHLGDDFGDKNLSIDMAKKRMIDCINYFQDKTDYLVLQMGFCWKGDTSKLLFENGTKQELIDFVRRGTLGRWEIINIGIAELSNGKTVYKPLNNQNIKRDDSLGEFRNRPIFHLKAKQ